MTHIYEVSVNEMHLLATEKKTFDVLQFRRPVVIGDTIIYQLEPPVENEDLKHASVPQEFSVQINFVFEDTEGALKKGYSGVGFKIEM